MSTGSNIADNTRLYRKIITIRAEDSPNVRLGLAEEQAGKKPSNRMLVPGVLPYEEYKKRRATWDPVRQSIGLDAKFWHGAEVLLYPPDWLNRAEYIADQLKGIVRIAKGIGIDPAEGGDRTCIAVVDEFGLIELLGCRTPDTQVIIGEAIRLIHKYGIAHENVCFDAGGGGYQLANQLRAMEYNVRTVRFGGAAKIDPNNIVNRRTRKDRLQGEEYKGTFKDQRAQMYDALHQLLDPTVNQGGFGLPAQYTELRRQLSLIPLRYDANGRFYMIPKNKKSVPTGEKTLIDILGHSPDDADALVLAIHAMKEKPNRVKVGAIRNGTNTNRSRVRFR